MALASLALEERHLLDAEKLAQAALDEFQAEKLRDDEVLARVVLAWSLLEQHKAVESRKQVGLAADLASKSPILKSVQGSLSLTQSPKALWAITPGQLRISRLVLRKQSHVAISDISMKSNSHLAR